MKNTAVEIVKTLQDSGFVAVFVGGCVRDMIMGNTVNDYDIATNALPEEVKEIFPDTFNVGEAFGVVCVKKSGHVFEVATLRTETDYTDGRHPETVKYSKSLHDDMKRRDFTINAIAFDPITGVFFDAFNGMEDIKRGIIRSVSGPGSSAVQRFKEDYLRILRGIRFATRFSFKIEPDTKSAMSVCIKGLKEISMERIAMEFRKMFSHKNRADAFFMLYDCFVFDSLFPEIIRLEDTEQKPEYHPEGNVFIHTHIAVASLPRDASFAVTMATILHDIGKPDTVDENLSCKGHAEVGAVLAEKICHRLKLPSTEIDFIVKAVGSHMRFYSVKEMSLAKLRKLIVDPDFEDMLTIHKADIAASTKDPSFADHIEKIRVQFENEPVLPAPLVQGRDLIKLGYKPSKKFGPVLKSLFDLQLEHGTELNKLLEIAHNKMKEITIT